MERIWQPAAVMNITGFSPWYSRKLIFLPFSIAQNVSASETDFDRDEVQKCLEQAGLWDKVKDFPKGMDTMLNRTLNEDAEELSGGEWQNFCGAGIV